MLCPNLYRKLETKQELAESTFVFLKGEYCSTLLVCAAPLEALA
jgi:hypothetical protein